MLLLDRPSLFWLVSTVLVGLTALVCVSVASAGDPCSPVPDCYSELSVTGESFPGGIFDPSVEYAPDGTGFLAYSALWDHRAETHLAVSTDNGGTWTKFLDLNVTTSDTVDGTFGVWQHEVPTLVFHPEDTARPWKLFWHFFFRDDQDQKRFDWGWVAMRHALHPAGPWSVPIRLFGAAPASGQVFPQPNLFPLHPVEGLYLNSLSTELDPFVGFTEFGTVVEGGILYFSTLGGVGLEEDEEAILLFSFDPTTQTWSYVSKVATESDAQAAGYDFFTGSSLALAEGENFLLLAPELIDPKALTGRRQIGTAVYLFEDIAMGTLQKNGSGVLVEHQFYPVLDPDTSGGQSDYDEQNTAGGLVMPMQPRVFVEQDFSVFNTFQPVPEPSEWVLLASGLLGLGGLHRLKRGGERHPALSQQQPLA